MIRLKTAVLLACSLKAGALLANSSDEVADKLYEFGINLGLSFQLQDDWLDTFGNQATFGKKIGGDILANKKTYLLINALEKASVEQRTELLRWIEKTEFDAEEKIAAVTNIYNQLAIKTITSGKVDFYFNKSIERLGSISIDNVVKQPLFNLANKMLTRKH
jgi:geranylgeranyl diphosphate synthase type II